MDDVYYAIRRAREGKNTRQISDFSICEKKNAIVESRDLFAETRRFHAVVGAKNCKSL